MAETQQGIQVAMEVGSEPGKCWVTLSAAGVTPITIPMVPQVAFETGEKLARAAHQAKFGTPWQSDESYLKDQIKKRTTEKYRMFLTQRVSLMLNSMREDKKVSNGKLAKEIVEQILNKVL